MLTEDAATNLAAMVDGSAVVLQAVCAGNWLYVGHEMSEDIRSLHQAKVSATSEGTNMSAERWVLSTVLTQQSREILAASTVTYKHLPSDKVWWTTCT